MNELFKSLGFNKEMLTLKNIVIGYKIQDKHYYPVNQILTVNILNIFKHHVAMQHAIFKYRHIKVPLLLQKTCDFLDLDIVDYTSSVLMETMKYIP